MADALRVAEMLSDLKAAEEALNAGADSARVDGIEYASADSIEDAVREMVLAVSVDISGVPLCALKESVAEAAESASKTVVRILLSCGGTSINILAYAEIASDGGIAISNEESPWIDGEALGCSFKCVPLEESLEEAVEWAALAIIG